MRYKVNETHEEEWEVYLESWSEDIREDLVAYLGNAQLMGMIDDQSEIFVTGGTSLIDAIVEIYAAHVEVTLPQADLRMELEVAGFGDEKDGVQVGISYVTSTMDNHDRKDDGVVFKVKDYAASIYETANTLIAKVVFGQVQSRAA